MLLFCTQTLLVACLDSLSGMMRKIRGVRTLQRAHPLSPKNLHWFYSLRWALHSYPEYFLVGTYLSVKPVGTPNPTLLSQHLVLAQFSPTADENRSARAGRGKDREDRIEPQLSFYGEWGESTNPNTPTRKKLDGWHLLRVPDLEMPHTEEYTVLSDLIPKYLLTSCNHRNVL